MTLRIVTIIISLFICISVAGAEVSSSEYQETLLNIARERDPKTRLALVEDLLAKCDEYQRFSVLPTAAKTAFEAGENAKAESYAQELLELAIKYPSDWNYGNAIHDGNMVLGRIALSSGDVESAKDHLLKAGKTPGSPQLNTFGPNMNLAKDLLERDEKEVVIEYFELCKKFWQMEDGRLDSWIASIKGGGMPYFGTNLKY